MKENIQRSGHEVAIVIYDAPLPPKYFRLNKKFLRVLFTVVPLLLIALLGSLFFWGLASRLNKTTRPNFPSQMNEHELKISQLESDLVQLKASNDQLTGKLASQQPSAPTEEDPFLMNIKRPYGMQNLLNKNLVSVDQFDFYQEPGKVGLKFQIISTTPEQRVTGHILVFLVSNTGTMAYPADANNAISEGIKYTIGEPFAVSRLRPTTAVFQQRPTGENVKFMVYIFSREGDLLLIKETQAYPIGAGK